METKPYNLQSPEQIAKDYGGNKQKIAEAMQMGIIDPTAGTMAGMFIDRMRSAAQMEAAPQQTVAQQVFAPPAPPQPQMPPQGAPPVPPGAGAMPPAPPAGLGATPEAAAMPPMGDMPPMGAPPQGEMPMMAEGGMVPPYMSGGGLSDLPVPDDMFDENRNGGFDDGYAGGGLVAFARGGAMTDEEAWGRIKRLEGGLGPRGEMRVSSAGAVGPSQLMPATAPEAARIAGLPWDEKRYRTDPAYNEALGKAYYLSRVAARGGDYSKAALDYHTGMGNVDKGKIGPAGREYLRKFSGAELPKRDINTTEGQVASVEDIFGRLQERFGPSEEERAARAKLAARAEELTSDEYQNKMRKDSLWETLASIGFNMASSKSPSLLQAVGEAAAAALPGAAADKKERKALKDRGLELMVELGAKDRKEAIPLWNMATEAAKTNMSQQQFAEKQKLDERQVAVAEKRLNEEIRLAGLTKPEDINDRVTRYLLDFPEGTPQHEAAKRVYAARNPASSTAGGLSPKEIVEAGRQGASGFSEGQTAKDTKGRTIVFQGGQWVYP
jgi:hypothetical protein